MSRILRTWPEVCFFVVRSYDHIESTDVCKDLTQEIGFSRDNEARSNILTLGQTLQGTRFRALNGKDLAKYFRIKDPVDRVPPISLSTQDVTRYKMAWRALEFYQDCEYVTARLPSRAPAFE